MSSSAPVSNVPTTGLPPGSPGDDDTPSRSGDDLIAAAAAGAKLGDAEQEDLLEFFLTNGKLPGDGKPYPVEFPLGHGDDERKVVWQFRRIEWEEWQDADRRATDEKTETVDAYVRASWVVARALLKPRLGPAVARQQQEAKDSSDHKIAGPDGARIGPPEDAAELLRRMFATQSGILVAVAGEVLQISKLAGAANVRTLGGEVEAGKL